MATYSIHYDYNGSTCTLEWRDASPGGTVFLSVEKWVDPDHTIIPFLAYDLRKTPNATPGTLWNRGTQVGTQYIERGSDVMISCTNYPFHDSNNVRDYDIYLDNSTTTYTPSSYPYVAREYWDTYPVTVTYSFPLTSSVDIQVQYQNTDACQDFVPVSWVFNNPYTSNAVALCNPTGLHDIMYTYDSIHGYASFTPNLDLDTTIHGMRIVVRSPVWSGEGHSYSGLNLTVVDNDDLAQQLYEYFAGRMTPPIYVGVNGKARQVTDMYVGVNGTARKVKAIYVGVNGRAREVFKAT